MSDILALIKLFVAEFGLYQVSKLYNILFQQLKERVPITLSRFSITLVNSWWKINFRPSTRELKVLLKKWNVTGSYENTNFLYIPLFHQGIQIDNNEAIYTKRMAETNGKQYFHGFVSWKCHRKLTSESHFTSISLLQEAWWSYRKSTIFSGDGYSENLSVATL